jgi:hypothetical protein
MDQNQIFPLDRTMAPVARAPEALSLVRRVWAPVVIGLGLMLTAAWVSLLAYGFVILLGNSL